MANRTLILVPGISGAELHSAGGQYLFPAKRIWLDHALLLAGAWRVLGLADDGTSPESIFFPTIEPGFPLPDYYGTLRRHFQVLGWRVLAPRVDWRRPIAQDGQRLADLIRSVARDSATYVLAHSRGGLVTREALRLLTATGEEQLVLRVVGLGVPHQGSYAAAALLGSWQQTKLLLYFLLEAFALRLRSQILESELTRITCTWPAVYELLPDPLADWVPLQDRTRLYDSVYWLAFGLPIKVMWLDAARIRWNALQPPAAAVDWVNVVGRGIATPASLGQLPITVPFSLPTIPEGDGTVPSASAQLAGRPTLWAPVGHSALPYDGRILRRLPGLLLDGLADDEMIAGPILQ